MNKPDGITQDAWDAASELLYAVDAMPSDGNIAIIAAAIQSAIEAERERAAKVLDDRAQEYNKIRDPGMANHCRALARTIRKGA